MAEIFNQTSNFKEGIAAVQGRFDQLLTQLLKTANAEMMFSSDLFLHAVVFFLGKKKKNIRDLLVLVLSDKINWKQSILLSYFWAEYFIT